MAADEVQRAPTLEDVARVAGVSRATVSRVVNDTRNVDRRIREVVQARSGGDRIRAQSGGALPGDQADRLGGAGRLRSRAPSFDDPFVGRVFTDPFFGRVVSGIISVLRPRAVNLVLMLAETDDSRAPAIDYLRAGARRRRDC